MLEIELKARVPDLEPVRERLSRLDAVPEGRIHERDIYYNAPHRDFARTDEALRIRFAGTSCVITYKGAKKKEFALKAREELNCGVESGEVMERILFSMGFTRVAEVSKWREYFRFRGAVISLDQVSGLGTFVEIELADPGAVEAPSEYVAELARELGVPEEPLLLSYLELLLDAQGRR